MLYMYYDFRTMEPLTAPLEVTYNWVDITSDFFEHIQGKT